VAGTLVQGENGKIPIDEIDSGAAVQAVDTGLRTVFVQKVIEVVHGESSEIVDLDFGVEVIQCTPGHRFFTGTWTEAGTLAVGHRVLCGDGHWQELRAVNRRTQEQPVFNLEVEGLHTYLIGQSGLVVHNIKNLPPDPVTKPVRRSRRQGGQAFAPKGKGRLSA
jgi:Pretoxin HINT domain